MAYLYQHIRLDNNKVFNIGIGKNPRRIFSKLFRNKLWHNIVNRAGFRAEKILDNLTWQEACEKEIEYINKYGRIDLGTGTLANMTNGGDGTPGYKHTEEWKRQNSLRNKGKIIPQYQKEILRKRMTGRIVSKEVRQKISETLKKKYPKKVITKAKKQDLRWINKDSINRKVDKNLINTFIEDGWKKGRSVDQKTKDRMSKKGMKWQICDGKRVWRITNALYSKKTEEQNLHL